MFARDLSPADKSVYEIFNEFGFKTLKRERSDGKGGGLAILFHPKMALKRMYNYNADKYDTFEYVWKGREIGWVHCPLSLSTLQQNKVTAERNRYSHLLASIKGQPRYEALIYRDGGIWCSHCQKKVSPARPYYLKRHCQSVRHKS